MKIRVIRNKRDKNKFITSTIDSKVNKGMRDIRVIRNNIINHHEF